MKLGLSKRVRVRAVLGRQSGCVLAGVVLGQLLSPGAQVGPEATRAEGVYEFVQSAQGGQEIRESGWFCAEVSSCQWRITTAAVQADLTNANAAYCCYSFDGKSLYRLTSLGAGTADGPTGKSVIRKTGIVSDGNFPEFDHSRVAFIWAAFASGCYLRENGLRRCRPLWAASPASFVSERGYLHTVVNLLEGEHGLPAKMVFLSDGDAFTDLPNPGNEVIKYPVPYDRGFVKAIYSVAETMSCAGRTFPRAFSLEVFNPLPTAKTSNELHKVWVLTGRVTDLRRTTPPLDWRPALAEMASIIDLRFGQEGVCTLEYVSKGWKSRTDPDLRLFLGREKGFKAKVEKRHASVRTVVLAVFALSAASLLCFAWWKRGFVHNRANNQKG